MLRYGRIVAPLAERLCWTRDALNICSKHPAIACIEPRCGALVPSALSRAKYSVVGRVVNPRRLYIYLVLFLLSVRS